jgi:hypothetical protein
MIGISLPSKRTAAPAAAPQTAALGALFVKEKKKSIPLSLIGEQLSNMFYHLHSNELLGSDEAKVGNSNNLVYHYGGSA